jgi:hypothetical protein
VSSRSTLGGVVVAALWLNLAAAVSAAPQGDPPLAQAFRITSAPAIDGRLDDAVWQRAAPISDFRQRDPQQGQPATERTVVHILYDESTLFVGAELLDGEPASIRASELRRDNELSSDDTFAVLLDTFHDHRNAFLFRVNARGTRFDAIVSNESHDVTSDWDEQWTAAAQVTEGGWTVEIAIPFKILRFTTDRAQTWGVNFERVIKRKNEETYWTNWDRNYNFTHVSQGGHLAGLEGIRQADRVRIRPYVVASAERLKAVESPRGARLDAEVGLDDLKVSLTSNLTADLAANPDFAQTEVDEQRVNLTRFSLFFPEKRQFFIEGADSFEMSAPQVGWGSPPAELFYSRRIGLSASGDAVPILAGGKLTGKVGGVDLGLMDVQTGATAGGAGENFAVVRARKGMLDRSYVGGLLTNRQDGGDSNGLWGADARFVFFKYLTLTGMAAGSTSSASGRAGQLRQAAAEWDDDFLVASLHYLDIDPGFDPGIGFVERNDRLVAARFALMPRPAHSIVRQFEFSPEATFHHDANGLLLTRELGFGAEAAFQTGDEIDIGIGNTVETLTEPFPIATGIVVPPGRYASVEASLSLGGFYSGTRRSLELDGSLRPNPHFSLGPTYELNDVDLREGAFQTHLLGLKANVSLTTNLLTAAYVQYNSAGELGAIQLRLNYIYRGIDNVYLVFNQTRYTGGRYAHRANTSLVLKTTYSIHW